jgi:site-specific recombinase XerD
LRYEPVSVVAATYVKARTDRREFTGDTPKVISGILRHFALHIGDPPVSTLTRKHIETWRSGQKRAPGTIRHRLYTVRAFCQWLVIHEHLDRDPTVGIKVIREPKAVDRALPVESVSKTLLSCPDLRASLIVVLMAQLGLRACEVATLEVGDIDQINRLLSVTGKGGHQRLVPVTEEAHKIISRYLTAVSLRAGPLVRSYRDPNVGVSARYISTLVSRWMYDAGVKQRPRDGVSGHALRHTAATDVMDTCGDPRIVQEMLGHAHLSSTERYLAKVRAERLRSAMEGRRYAL